MKKVLFFNFASVFALLICVNAVHTQAGLRSLSEFGIELRPLEIRPLTPAEEAKWTDDLSAKTFIRWRLENKGKVGILYSVHFPDSVEPAGNLGRRVGNDIFWFVDFGNMRSQKSPGFRPFSHSSWIRLWPGMVIEWNGGGIVDNDASQHFTTMFIRTGTNEKPFEARSEWYDLPRITKP